MNKKWYVTPEMEIEDVELVDCLMFNTSSGDPAWAGDDEEFPGEGRD